MRAAEIRVATGASIGLCRAERYRPELVFLDLGVANVHAVDACRVLSSLSSRAGRRTRVPLSQHRRLLA